MKTEGGQLAVNERWRYQSPVPVQGIITATINPIAGESTHIPSNLQSIIEVAT